MAKGPGRRSAQDGSCAVRRRRLLGDSLPSLGAQEEVRSQRKRRENTIAGRGKEKCEEVRESEKAGGAVGRLRLRKSCSGSFFFCWLLSGAWTANELKAAPVAAAGSAEASRRLDAYRPSTTAAVDSTAMACGCL